MPVREQTGREPMTHIPDRASDGAGRMPRGGGSVSGWNRQRVGGGLLAAALLSGLAVAGYSLAAGHGPAEALLSGVSAACFGPLIAGVVVFLLLYLADMVIRAALTLPLAAIMLVLFVLHAPRRWIRTLASVNARLDDVADRVTCWLISPILWFRTDAQTAEDTP